MPSMSRSPSSSSPPSLSLMTQPSMPLSLSSSPSMSPLLSSVPSSSSAPADTCYWIDITIVYDVFPEETWLELWMISVDVGQDYEVTISQKEGEPGDYELVKLHNTLGDTSYSESICPQEREYRFAIFDLAWGNGICCYEGNYNVTISNGELIAEGGVFSFAESTMFTIPFITAPSSMPSISRSPASSSSLSTIPSFSLAPLLLSFASRMSPSPNSPTSSYYHSGHEKSGKSTKSGKAELS